MESFSSGKIGRDINAIVNSKPRGGGGWGGGQGRNACSLFMGLCNSINIDA